MFSVVYGSQTEQQYSSLGRTRDWYALSFTDFELIWRLRLMNERDLFALDVICWMWLFHFKSDDSVNPRYFADLVVNNFYCAGVTDARGTDHPLFSNFLFTNLFSIRFLYFFIISSLFLYFNLFVSVLIQSYVNIKLHVSTLYRY
jgi:hypothetical protein